MSILLKEEALSFQAMPEDCPMHYLDFGLLTELILPLVKINRRDKREQRKEYLVKKTLNVILRQCIRELYNLSVLYPEYALIHNRRWRSKVNNKNNIIKFIDTNKIPLIYFEEAYQKQLEGPPKLVENDWIKCNNEYGVISNITGNSTVSVKLVRKMIYQEKDISISSPMFHRWLRNYRNSIEVRDFSIWECQKIGHDTPEWIYLRNKLIKDYNENLEKRKELWEQIKPILIQYSVMDNPIRSREILRSYRLTWLQMRVNVLDKSMWENLKPFRNNNPPHLHSLWWYSNYSDYHSIMGANIENLRNTVLELEILD